jgi:ABC-type sugar transport system ATPase subunit
VSARIEVRIEDLRFARGGRVVLDISALVLRSDRTTAILGPNGAGKTTLLRLLAGLERPADGRIRIARPPAHDCVDRPDGARQSVAFVFQEDVFLRQSVRENLELGLRLRGVRKDERAARIHDAAHLLGIGHLLGRRADRLSGGEGRRASLARALCLHAPLVLLDEPLAGLDPPTYARLLDELPRVLGAFGATTVIVTHDRDEALRLGEDLVVLIDGRVRGAGAKREVVLHPADSAVAEILGYLVLDRNGHDVAVRTGALEPGPGAVEFDMEVEELLDLVDRREVVGRIGRVRAHVVVPAAAEMPRPGDRVLVHADWAYELT